MAEIKTDENTSESLDQDPTDSVSNVTSKERDMANSWPSISDPTAMT